MPISHLFRPARVVIVQTEVNRVEQFLEVGMKTKVMDSQFNPLDAVRVFL